MSGIIPFPLDKVLELVTILTAVEDGLNFIFKVVVYFKWRRRWGISAIDVVAQPRGEAIDMEHRMLAHRWGQTESVGEVTSFLDDFIWAQLARVKLSAEGGD